MIATVERFERLSKWVRLVTRTTKRRDANLPRRSEKRETVTPRGIRVERTFDPHAEIMEDPRGYFDRAMREALKEEDRKATITHEHPAPA